MITIANNKSKVLVRQRGKNSWEYSFEGQAESIIDNEGKDKDKNGKLIPTKKKQRRRVSKSGFTSEREARAAGDKAYAEYLINGGIVKTEIKTVSDLVDEYFKHLENTDKSYKTITSYNSCISIIVKTIGAIKLENINQYHVNSVMNELKKKKLADTSMSQYIRNYKHLFDFALKRNIIKVNPFIDIHVSATNGTKKDRVYSEEKIKELFTAYKNVPELFIWMTIAYHTGMRLSEICGLTWNDIDFNNQTLKVQHQIRIEKGDLYIRPPKCKSVREIFIDDELTDFLRELKDKTKRKKYSLDGNKIVEGNSFSFVVTNKKGGAMPACKVQNKRLYLINKKNYPYFTPHSFRHTHCTRLIDDNIDPKFVQERLGHKNLSTTINIYNHLTDKMRNEEKQKLNNLFKTGS